jgi:hypothetical protein
MYVQKYLETLGGPNTRIASDERQTAAKMASYHKRIRSEQGAQIMTPFLLPAGKVDSPKTIPNASFYDHYYANACLAHSTCVRAFVCIDVCARSRMRVHA